MSRSGKSVLHIIDALGGCTVAACVLGFVWLTMIRNDPTAARIEELTSSVQRARQDVRVLQAAKDRQRVVLTNRQAELATTGQLPAQAPVEEYFQTLSTIASQNRLRVIRHNPLTPRRYPGLLEQRYAYELTGSMPDLLRFLKWIEDSDFWADVSYLTVAGGTGPEDAPSNGRAAVLAISLFSALPSDTPSQSGDG